MMGDKMGDKMGDEREGESAGEKVTFTTRLEYPGLVRVLAIRCGEGEAERRIPLDAWRAMLLSQRRDLVREMCIEADVSVWAEGRIDHQVILGYAAERVALAELSRMLETAPGTPVARFLRDCYPARIWRYPRTSPSSGPM